MLIGLLAAAAVAVPAPLVITHPEWLTRPDGNDIAIAYPFRAQLHRRESSDKVRFKNMWAGCNRFGGSVLSNTPNVAGGFS